MKKPLFSMPKSNSANDGRLLKRKSAKTKSSARQGGGTFVKLSSIVAAVSKYLKDYIGVYKSVESREELEEYVRSCLECGEVAIDTETTGLNPIINHIVGFSLYTPSKGYPIYVPLNHISYLSNVKLKHQMSEEDAISCLKKLVKCKEIIMFNAGFDCRVFKNSLGIQMPCTWDTSLASRCLNENEPEKALKKLYQKYILKSEKDAFKYEELFEGLTFDKVTLDVAYLYAAHDAKITYELYEFQKPFLDYSETCEKAGLKDVAWVFHNIEMPCVPAVCEMEDTGVLLDMKVVKELNEKYSAELAAAKENAYRKLDLYTDEIASYSGSVKLDNPINLDSPKQLAVVLYDIMGLTSKDKKKPRGTGEEILSTLGDDFAEAVLEYRTVNKLINTYIDKLPKCVLDDGRIHCNFNQYGADTGRFSSKNPNVNWAAA